MTLHAQKPRPQKKILRLNSHKCTGMYVFCCGHQNGTIDIRYMRSKQQSNDNTLMYRFGIICVCVWVCVSASECASAWLGECICAALIKSPNVFIIILWNQNRMCFCWQYVACGACFDSSLSPTHPLFASSDKQILRLKQCLMENKNLFEIVYFVISSMLSMSIFPFCFFFFFPPHSSISIEQNSFTQCAIHGA